MVVFIHVIFPGKIGTVLETLARFAVPFFFFISGFYSYGISPTKIINRIKKILTLIIFATVSYTLFNISLLLLSGGWNDVSAYFSNYVDFGNVVKLIFLNIPVRLEYLWYLYAMLYVYIFFYFTTIFRVNEKVIFTLSFSLLIVHVLLVEVLSVYGIFIPSQFVRNFAVMGIPFFVVGSFAKIHQNKFRSVSNLAILLLIIIGTIESILSRYFFDKKEIYFGSLFILFALVCVFIKYSTVSYHNFFTSLEGCSTYIYIFHDMVSKAIRAIYVVLGISVKKSVVLTNLHPLIVCISSTIFAYLLIKIKRRLNNYLDCV